MILNIEVKVMECLLDGGFIYHLSDDAVMQDMHSYVSTYFEELSKILKKYHNTYLICDDDCYFLEEIDIEKNKRKYSRILHEYIEEISIIAYLQELFGSISEGFPFSFVQFCQLLKEKETLFEQMMLQFSKQLDVKESGNNTVFEFSKAFIRLLCNKQIVHKIKKEDLPRSYSYIVTPVYTHILKFYDTHTNILTEDYGNKE